MVCPTQNELVSPRIRPGPHCTLDSNELARISSDVASREILQRLDRIEKALSTLMQLRTVKDYYSTDEVAGIVGKAEFTVREWARHGRINAQKRRSGRGKHQSWVISNEELQRIQCEGLLPENR